MKCEDLQEDSTGGTDGPPFVACFVDIAGCVNEAVVHNGVVDVGRNNLLVFIRIGSCHGSKEYTTEKEVIDEERSSQTSIWTPGMA